MREKLEKIKSRIVDGRKQFYELAKNKKEIVAVVNDYVKTVKGEIAEEINADGKAMYSNQAKRDAEFIERTENDCKYKNVLEKLEKIQEEMTDIEMQIESAVYDFKIEDILSRLQSE